jgi:D-3-phosphoglycerate dehydrogenase
MTVLAVDPYLTEEEIERRGARRASFEQVLERSDFVTLHCPRDKDTLKMMDAGAFARMKKGAVFVTTARGGIHDEAALHEALTVRAPHGRGSRCLGQGAAAPRSSAPQAGQRRRHLPHAGVTNEARRNMATYAAEQIVGSSRADVPRASSIPTCGLRIRNVSRP